MSITIMTLPIPCVIGIVYATSTWICYNGEQNIAPWPNINLNDMLAHEYFIAQSSADLIFPIFDEFFE